MPDTTLARMALCDAIADHRDHQHSYWFAQLLFFSVIEFKLILCDWIWSAYYAIFGNEAECVARLKAVYHSVFTSAGRRSTP
jgi:hypothetical protein